MINTTKFISNPDFASLVGMNGSVKSIKSQVSSSDYNGDYNESLYELICFVDDLTGTHYVLDCRLNGYTNKLPPYFRQDRN